MVITMGFAGGFTGGYFASRGDPFWTISGGLAGVIAVSAGADVYAPTLAYLLVDAHGGARLLRGRPGSSEDARRRRRRRGRGPRRARASSGCFWVGVFAAGYPTGINNVESSIGGQMMGILTFLPLGFL